MTRKQYEPVYRPLITQEEHRDLFTEKIPAAAIGATVPVALVFRKLPFKQMLVRAGEAAGLGAASVTAGFLGVHGFRGAKEQARQRRALLKDPLHPNERLQIGFGGRKGVWRSVGDKNIFIEVRRKEYSLEGKDLHIDCAMSAKKRIPLKPSGRAR